MSIAEPQCDEKTGSGLVKLAQMAEGMIPKVDCAQRKISSDMRYYSCSEEGAVHVEATVVF